MAAAPGRARARPDRLGRVQPVLVVLLVVVLVTAVTLILLQSAGDIHLPFLGGGRAPGPSGPSPASPRRRGRRALDPAGLELGLGRQAAGRSRAAAVPARASRASTGPMEPATFIRPCMKATGVELARPRPASAPVSGQRHVGAVDRTGPPADQAAVGERPVAGHVARRVRR